MDGTRFDAIAKSVAVPATRRAALGALAAGGLVSALGLRRSSATVQGGACTLAFVATVRLGPGAGQVLTPGGARPGELRGELSFDLSATGGIDKGTLRLPNGSDLPVVGQATGRSLQLRIATGQGRTVVVVGVGEQDLTACQGAVDGLATGPQPGDLGDWHATAKRTGGAGGSGGAGGTGTTPRSTSRTAAATAVGVGPTRSTDRTATATSKSTATTTTDPTAAATTEPTADATTGPTATTSVCPPGQTECGKACVDLQTDPANCGVCGNACAGCSAGECPLGPAPHACAQLGGACAADADCCIGYCDQDSRCECVGDGSECYAEAICCNGQPCNADGFCGVCGTPGAPCNSDAECCTGSSYATLCCFDGVSLTTRCTDVTNIGFVCPGDAPAPVACPDGQTDCGGACVDLSSDAGNCGACGTSCPLGGVCTGGTCVAPGPICSEGLTDCGGVCVDLSSDVNNCGGCGLGCFIPLIGDATCVNGVCD